MAEIWDVIGPMFDGVIEGGPATWVENEILVVDRNGFAEEAYFTWSYGAIHDDSGEQVVGILNVATEVTDKVLAERRAQVSAELVAALADAPSLRRCASAHAPVLGSHTEDHLGVDLVWAEGNGASRGKLDQLDDSPGSVGDGAVHMLPVLEPGLQEPTAHLHLTANPRRPWDASLQAYAELCASHVAMALSGLRRLQDERNRAEVLTALDTAKSDFFANVSHELRTPLTLIAGPVQDALADPTLEAEARERFELIRRNTDRLVGLVDRILDLTLSRPAPLRATHWCRPTWAISCVASPPTSGPRSSGWASTSPSSSTTSGENPRRCRHARAHRAQSAVERPQVHPARSDPAASRAPRRRLRDLRDRHRHRHRRGRPRPRLRPLPPAEPQRRTPLEGGRGHRAVARPASS